MDSLMNIRNQIYYEIIIRFEKFNNINYNNIFDKVVSKIIYYYLMNNINYNSKFNTILQIKQSIIHSLNK